MGFSALLERFASFTIYSGNTLENFRAGAVITEGGVSFNKKRQSLYYDRQLHWTTSLDRAQFYALLRSTELHQTPIVMEGRRSRIDLLGMVAGGGKLHERHSFPVSRIWLVKEDYDWTNWKVFGTYNDLFREEIPTSVLL